MVQYELNHGKLESALEQIIKFKFPERDESKGLKHCFWFPLTYHVYIMCVNYWFL